MKRTLLRLIILPLLICALVVAFSFATGPGIAFTLAQPGAEATAFLDALLNVRVADAATYLEQPTDAATLTVVGRLLRTMLGAPVTTRTSLRAWSPRRAIVMTSTRTAYGNDLTLIWELVRVGDHWRIRNCDGLHSLVPNLRLF